MSIVKCQWCDETIGDEKNPKAFEEEHVSCQKAYRRGQQWAIDKIRHIPWMDVDSPDEWLTEQRELE